MNISSLLKQLDLSWFKTLFLACFNKEALYEYALDKANTAVNLLLAANAETVAAIRLKLANLNSSLQRFTEYIPAPWLTDAQNINQLLISIYTATEDAKIVSDEAKEIIEKFQIAYSNFKSED